MAHISAKDVEVTVLRLLENHQFEQAINLVERFANAVQKSQHWDELRLLIQNQFTPEQRLTDKKLAPLYARTLIGSYELEQLKDFLRQALAIHDDSTKAKLLLEQSFLDYVSNRFEAATLQLEQALPLLDGVDRGIALARLGMNCFKLGLANWQEPFMQMRQYLVGRSLGIQLVNEASCYKQLKQIEKAISIYYEALPHLKQDTFNHANLQTSLGLTLLQLCRVEAIEHFEIAERMTRGKNYRKLHAHIKKCMAAYYTMVGQWSRAIGLYKQCIKIASNPASMDLAARDEATLNLGRTLRLQGHVTEALVYLQEELIYYPLGASGVLIERAAAYLQLGMLENAQNCLVLATQAKAEDADLKAILEAEMYRQSGNIPALLKVLEAVPMNEIMAREEAFVWTELWQIAAAHGMVIPEPIAQPSKHQIHLMNLGTPKLLLNNREVMLPPRAFELLAYLSWYGGSRSIQDCIEALYPKAVSSLGEYMDRFERIIETIRDTIALPNILQRRNSALELSQEVIWIDDALCFTQGQNIPWRGIYLAGIERNWIDDVALQLENIRLDRYAQTDLTESDELRILELAKRIQKNKFI
jgi:tetratricopeptide (TPR) repeat protein